jgi:3,4-dihydroxy 2-butanone 4-phosphate synthase/GTP cyclohydrolase II
MTTQDEHSAFSASTRPHDALRSTRAVEHAVAALAGGGMAVVVDDEDRENEGDLVLGAEGVTAEQVAFVVRHTTGILCAPMPSDRADRLGLPPMVSRNTDSHETAFTVTVDHMDSGTGVAAADRALTFRSLADMATAPHDLRRPGHVFPLRARPGGVLERPGHTEAAVDLLRLAGRQPVALIGEIVSHDGSMMRGPDLRRLASEHGLPYLSVADLVRYRLRKETVVRPASSAVLPTEFGEFKATVFRSTIDGSEHLALVMGDVASGEDAQQGVLVRVHSECLTGDIVGSLRCDCGLQLEQSMVAIAGEGRGVVIYLRGHEGRGIGLGPKIHAYALQEAGLDTVDANTAQGLPVDARTYDAAGQILEQLDVRSARLITNNPDKYAALVRRGIAVERVALPTSENPHNRRYLRTKRDRMGHALSAVV